MAKVVINEKNCKSCYLCIDACPKGCLKKSNRTGATGNFVVEFDESENKCIGCCACAMTCPDLAITEVYR